MSEQVKDPSIEARAYADKMSEEIFEQYDEFEKLLGRIALDVGNLFSIAHGDGDLAARQQAAGQAMAALNASIRNLRGEFSVFLCRSGDFSRVRDLYEYAIDDLFALGNKVIGKHRENVVSLQSAKDELAAKLARRGDHPLHSPEVREKVWAITAGRCFYCSVELLKSRVPGEEHRQFEVDHIVPKSSGGPDHISNFVPSCHACNQDKLAEPFHSFVLRKFDLVRKDEPAAKVNFPTP